MVAMKRFLLLIFCLSLFSFHIAFAENSWLMYQHDAHHSGYTPSKILIDSISLKWKTKIDTIYPIHACPAIVDGTIYITGKNNFYAVNLANGNILWKLPLDIQTEWGNGRGTPGIVDNTIYITKTEYFGNFKGYVYCLSSNGEIEWTYSEMSAVDASPTIKDGIIFIHDLNGSLYAICLSDGKLLWKFSTGEGGHSSPVVVNDIVFIGAHNKGNLYAIDRKNGNLLWEYTGEGPIHRIASGGQKIYLNSGHLICLNIKDGKTIWEYAGRMESNPAIKGDRLFAAAGSPASGGVVFCLDTRLGKLLWEKNIGEYVNIAWSYNDISDIVATEDYVFAGIREGFILGLDSETGEILWKYGTGGMSSAPALVDGYIVVIGEEGSYLRGEQYLYCFHDKGLPFARGFETTIEGKIVNDENIPLPGAIVKIAGVRVKTDLQGKYIIKLKNYMGDTLVQSRAEDKERRGYWIGESVGFVNAGDKGTIDVKTTFRDYDDLP